MNAFTPIVEAADGNMTSKGQVLIPKSLRDRAGLIPGSPVVVGLNASDQVVVLSAADAQRQLEAPEERRARIIAALDEIAGKYDFGGGTTEEIMHDLRGDRAP